MTMSLSGRDSDLFRKTGENGSLRLFSYLLKKQPDLYCYLVLRSSKIYIDLQSMISLPLTEGKGEGKC